MQRQSLGGSSPGSKNHNINGLSKEVIRLIDEEVEETTRKNERGVVISDNEEENKKKSEKLHHHHHRSISRTEKSIHLIPILTIFCLLVLYLCSYDPPPKDLAHIDGFRRISKRIDSTTEISDIGRYLEVEKSDILPVRSHRSLHEIRKDGRRSRFHRKIGDY